MTHVGRHRISWWDGRGDQTRRRSTYALCDRSVETARARARKGGQPSYSSRTWRPLGLTTVARCAAPELSCFFFFSFIFFPAEGGDRLIRPPSFARPPITASAASSVGADAETTRQLSVGFLPASRCLRRHLPRRSPSAWFSCWSSLRPIDLGRQITSLQAGRDARRYRLPRNPH